MKKLTLKEKISYGFGDMGNGFMFDMGQLYLLKFFTDIAGIPAAVAGGIFLFTKLFDAIVDPLAGTFIDSRKGKPGAGKYRQIMLLASIVLAIISVFVFLAPGFSLKGKIIYAYGSYMAWGVAYSFTNIPYGTLAATMTQDPQERTSLASFRQLGSTMALLISTVVVVPLVAKFNNPNLGWPVAIGIMALFGIGAFYVTFRNCRENIPVAKVKTQKIDFKDIVKTIFTNRPLLVLILMTIFSISAFNLRSAMLLYFCQYNLGNKGLMAYVGFVAIGCSLLGVVAMPILSKRFGKKNTVIIGFAISIIADLLNFMIPLHLVTFIILQSIAYFGLSIPNGMTWALVSDAIDYGEWKTGEKRGAITYSVFNFSRKIAQSVAGFAAGIGLSLTGYIPKVAQTAGALFGIKGLLLLYPAFALGIAILVISTLYNLTDKKYLEIASDLRKRNS
ncbi:glycoside-pentoside-hexuronide (GPH):cation symporter [Clostridium estertheticum]|uniref:MFS transporter n=1 Tax=Clostridium estertheticum TaxID=238834 RepID=A0A7Y3STC6_9CLOT|nr:glycoside-pentoside-hexuronide (GPH):cation symporter [Clostridium estertheticum]MBW9171498.1 glycoside-pentoside-hexuronide (GPH):cation symporter [Clostridium estertheticum]MBX4264243.1 glycoside-pentoside-hexuronide (GPH):cation symporter [Clostridium estertheticum]NNU74553.1 MFS transporter [Clostridium estertheticum]WBL48949.1 glycoside-pentoside-hexuronide (GPH):cation symporter [Clostridium estertheticum]WLC77001.1 glycoside-pentoside-hexuronide (GPH):cation symporter [Clostridium es